MSNTPTLRFGEFDGEWSEKRLGSLGSFKGGGTPSKLVDAYWSGSIPWISSSDIIDDDILNIKINRFINENAIKQSATKIIPKGSVLFVSRVGVGKLAINQDELCTSQDFTNFIPKNVNNYYLGYYFQANTNLLARYSQGTSIKGFTKSDIETLKVPIPAKPEQQKIATFLSAVDSSIEQLSQKEQLLRDYKKGVMQKIFSRQIRFKRDDGGEFEDWVEKRLGDVFTFLRGSTLSKSDMTSNGINKCIHYGELFTTYKEKIETIKSSTNLIDGQLSCAGDILMPSSDVTPQGLATASALLEENIIIGGDINILRPKQNLDSLFVSYFLNSNKNEIMKLVTGTTVKHIYNKDVSKLKINLPSLPEQTKIANFLSSLDKQIEQVSTQLAETKNFKRGLLQQMFV